MSTKFNRNDVQAGNDKFYLDDYKTDLNGMEQDLLDAIKHFEILPCIIEGLNLTPAAYPSTTITVAAGQARDADAKPIVISVGQDVDMTDTAGGNNYVILNHKYSTDTERKAYESGENYNTRKYDDYDLTVAATYDEGDIVLGNVKREGSENVLYETERTPDVAKPFAIVPPPIPTRLDLSTDWDDAHRINGASAGLISMRPAYIKADFGDKGTGTASSNTFTYVTNRVGAWTVNEWVDHYLTCSDGNSWKVVSNTADTLTLESGAVPVTGDFWLGPNAAGYKFVIEVLDPVTEDILVAHEAENQVMTSPVKMEYIWNGLTPDVKYRVRVASKGSWFQKDWSDFCDPGTIIAGGPKEIPSACADVLDGDVTISADDDGIRLNWAIKAEYEDDVAGFEICWTDDGTSTPDFDNKNHRKVFTDRNFLVIPTRMSIEGSLVMVKAKMRAVDKAGRHCVTPKTLTDTNAKKYPGDLANLVTDINNIITPGGFPTLKSFVEKSINLSDGRGKMVSEFESQMDDLRSNYRTPGDHLRAVLQAGVDWEYVRIVALDGTGHYSSLQAVIDDIPTDDTSALWTVYFMPGLYNEAVEVPAGVTYSLSLVGLGNVVLKGSIRSLDTDNSVYVKKIANLRFLQAAAPTGSYPCLTMKSSASTVMLRDCVFISYASSSAVYPLRILGANSVIINNVDMYSRHECIKMAGYSEKYVKIQGCHLYSMNDNDKNAIYLENPGIDYLVFLRDTDLRTKTGIECIDADAGSQANNKIFMRHCGYVVAPNGTNLTIDYGTAENQSNVAFGESDFFGQLME